MRWTPRHATLVSTLAAALLTSVYCPAEEATPADPALVFEVNFDSWSVNASHAKGEPKCASFENPDLQLRMFSGVKNQTGGIKLRNSEYCQYPMKSNFDPAQGTISLWVSPQGWKGSDDHFHLFFTAKDQNYRMIVYKYYQWARLNFLLEVTDAKGELTRHCAWGTIEDGPWSSGKWRKIDAVWNAQGMRLYLDGALAAGASECEFKQPLNLPAPSDKGTLIIGTDPEWLNNPNCAKDEETAFDNIMVFNRTLSPNEIKADFEKYYPSGFDAVPSKNLVTIPLAIAAGEIDGTLKAEEWAAAAKIPVMAFREAPPKALRSWAWLLRGKEDLRIALRSEAKPPFKTSATKRDGNVWEDDSFEFFLLSPKGDKFHFIVNPNGALFDEKNGDAVWNSGAVAKATQDADGWSAELSIPLKDLAGAGAFEGGSWRGNVFSTYLVGTKLAYSGWSTPSVSYHETENYGTFAFGNDDAAARMEEIGHPALGTLDLKASIVPATRSNDFTVNASYELDGGEKVSYPDSLAGKEWSTRLPSGRQKLVMDAIRTADKQPIYHYENCYYVSLPLEITYSCYPTKGHIEVLCDTSNAGEEFGKAITAGQVSGTAKLVDTRTKKILAEAEFKPAKTQSSVRLAMPQNLPQGIYEISVAMKPSGGGEPIAKTETLRMPDLAVYKNPPMVDHNVPPPWTPVKRISDNEFEVWGRHYNFAGGPFPAHVASGGVNVLNTPVELLIDIDGTPTPVVWQDSNPGESYDDMVTFNGSGNVKDGSKLKLTWKTQLWFDGVSRTDFTLIPSNPVTINSMVLKYSVDAAAGKFVLTPLLNKWEGDKMELEFNPVPNCMKDFSLWITGHDRGLFWWPESNANWIIEKGAKPIQLAKNGTDVAVKISIIGKPVELKTPAPYAMVFMASPARKPPERARSFHVDGWMKPRRQNMQTTSWGSFADKVSDDDCTDFVSQKPYDLKRFTANVRSYNGLNIGSLPYSQPTYFTSLEPEYDCFRKVWEQYPAATFDGSKAGVKYKAFPGCSNSQFADYTVQRAVNLMDVCPEIAGLYYDLCWVVYCENAEHGCGGVDAFGNKILKSSGWGMRSSLMRIYKAAHARNKIVMNHNHSLFNPIAHNFTDYWYPGEQYEPAILQNPEHFYCENISLEAYQSELSMRIKGVGIAFLPQYMRAWEMNKSLRDTYKFDSETYTHRTLAPLVLHDIPVSASWMNLNPVDRLWGMGDYTDLSSAEFKGYWENNAIKADAPGVYISYYTWKKDNVFRVLFVAVNMTRGKVDFSVSIDKKALGLNDATLQLEDAMNREKNWSVADKIEGLSLAGNTYQFIGLK